MCSILFRLLLTFELLDRPAQISAAFNARALYILSVPFMRLTLTPVHKERAKYIASISDA
jgi:hypothetical protein